MQQAHSNEDNNKVLRTEAGEVTNKALVINDYKVSFEEASPLLLALEVHLSKYYGDEGCQQHISGA